jgi:outer membrane protein assembly factor BamD (BamD/ComL family)
MLRTNTLNQTHSKAPGLGYFLVLILASLLAVLASATDALGAQNIEKLNRLVQTTSATEPAAKMFREARALFDGKKWARAAERFSDFINDYPNEKNIDAALFWRAYALARQKKNREALEDIERLLASFPNSTWRDDAVALKVQITNNPDLVGEEENEELRIIALQGIFQSRPAEAIPIAAEWLKPGSKRSQEAKEAAISLLGQYGGAQGAAMLADIVRNEPNDELREAAIHWVAMRGTLDDLIKLYDAERSQDVKQSLLHRIAEKGGEAAMAKLMQVAKSDPNTELRESAIHRIAERAGPQAVALLIQLYDAESNQDVKESLLHRMAERWQNQAAQAKLMDVAKNDPNTEMRESAIHRIAERSDLDYVIQLFDTERNSDIKQSLLHRIAEKARSQRSSSQTKDAAMAKLLDVAKNAPDNDLRESAIHRISEMRGPDTFKLITQLYDSEKNRDVKESLLHRISERQEPEALQKLIAIAQSDANEELRASAIHRIAERRGGQGVDALIQFYDNEKSAEVKENILHRLGEAARNPTAGDSPQKRAMRKLMQIAKSDSSIELRKQAIHWLGQSKDPEARTFIEEIVK